MGESYFVRREPCPKCGSRDNLARYSDGHAYCFGASCDYYEPADGGFTPPPAPKPKNQGPLVKGKHMAISARGITEETARRYDYAVGKFLGEAWHIANYRNMDGEVVAQHLRNKDKRFLWVGDTSNLQLFGFHAFPDGGPKVIVTEGEIDAMSVFQALGHRTRFAVVSLTSGAKGAKRDLARNLRLLERFDEIILMFDNDEAGRAAVKEAVKVLPPGKAKVATLPAKDANQLLMEGREDEIVQAVFAAQPHRPEGVVTAAEVAEKAIQSPVMGLPWWHNGLTEVTLGRRMGELVALGAGTGVGKTDFLTQQIEYDINTLGEKVAIFFLEQQPEETLRRLAGKMSGKRFHIPPSDENPWEQSELEEAVNEIAASNNLYLYDHFGVADWRSIEETIRYLYHSEGVRVFYIDHLTALAAHADDERKELEAIMADAGGLVKELDIWICIVSHLATPEGKPHEEGGRVMIRHFKGSRAIGYWSHFMFGLERNQQAEDEYERHTTVLRVLKDRVTGQGTGTTFDITYDKQTGRLQESGSLLLGDIGEASAAAY